jgi:hypothetical protein
VLGASGIGGDVELVVEPVMPPQSSGGALPSPAI